MRTINRLLGAGLLLALAVSPTTHVAHAQGQSGLRVVKRALKPTSLPGSGGIVFVSVQVSNRGAAIGEVRAQGQVTGSPDGQIVTLTRRGKTYQGQVRVPANTSEGATTARIVIFVTSAGSTQERVLNPRIRMGPGNGGGGGGGGGELPPPPPPPSFPR